MRVLFFFCLSLSFYTPSVSQRILAKGEQPQMSKDYSGLIRVVYGETDKIYYSQSKDNGLNFSAPAMVAEVTGMHLGMTRGPQLVSSKDYSLTTAIDKKGIIHAFLLTHKTGKWTKIRNVNDVTGSAEEGLMSIASDDKNNFYAVWLDLRESRNNNICFSSWDQKNGWSKNKMIYKSPDSKVCECCKPSIAVKGNNVSIMFRNWINGSRDLYFISSTNQGETFGEANKLGNGTWKLNGCPMDGGGLLVDKTNNIHTFWQREGQVYYARPGSAETKIGDGRHCGIGGNKSILLTWEEDGQLKIQRVGGKQLSLGKGTALQIIETSDSEIIAVWEKDDQIQFRKLSTL
jgi:hypothetical protein